MSEEITCPKHNIALKLRKNVKTGELALACPSCDMEEDRPESGDIPSGARNTEDE
jgi:hypothetical protein